MHTRSTPTVSARSLVLASSLILVLACDLAPLSHEQLHGSLAPSADAAAGGRATDAGLMGAGDAGPTAAPDAVIGVVVTDPADADAVRDRGGGDSGRATGADQTPAAPVDSASNCQAGLRNGLLSGSVVDACSNAQLDAYVGIAGQHLCAFQFKGSYFFQNLPVGCALTLTARKEGYEPHAQEITIAPNGTANVRIALRRLGGCSAPAPQPVACVCDQPGCVAP